MKDNFECGKICVFLLCFQFKNNYDKNLEIQAQLMAIYAQPPHSLKPQSFQKEEDLLKQA